MIVLDTNVVSELMRSVPEPSVVSWLRARSADELVTTAVTLAEIGYGLARRPAGQRRAELEGAASAVSSAFPKQVLAFDAEAAQQYGAVVDRRERSGAPIDGFDAQIASICRAHNAALATRNVRDFDDTGVTMINPWLELS